MNSLDWIGVAFIAFLGVIAVLAWIADTARGENTWIARLIRWLEKGN